MSSNLPLDHNSLRSEPVHRFRPVRSWPDGPEGRKAATWAIVTGISVLVVAWLILVLTVDGVRFVISNSVAKTGLEVFLGFALLFAALVLLLAPVGAAAGRMHWVASGFFMLGMGSLLLGYVYPLFIESPKLNALM